MVTSIAERHQVVGDGERGGSGADAGDALAVLLRGNRRQQAGDIAAQIGGDALEAADGDGLDPSFGQASAAAGGFAGAVAGAAENAGEDVRLPIEHVGIGVPALRDQTNVFGNVGVGGTSPLAVDYFMKVVRIGGISRMHWDGRLAQWDVLLLIDS